MGRSVPKIGENGLAFHDLPEHSRPHNATFSGTRKHPRSVPLPSATAQILEPRATIRSTLAAGKPVYTGWHEPHLTKTPWELERHKKSWRRSRVLEVQSPVKVFKELPKEVYGCIVEQLERMHLNQNQACSSCYLNDLYSLALVSRAWDKAVTSRMYGKIMLLASSEQTKLPKLNVKGTGRLKLLRRTLRERTALARCVRELHISDFQTLYHDATIEREGLVNLVASLVMACPFLERLVGFHVPFTHSFDRLSHALSTRPNLKERMWLLSEHNTDSSDEEDGGLGAYYLAACDTTERFLELNSNHSSMSTMVLHQDLYQESVTLNFRAIIGTIRQLPTLRHLTLSGLSASSFTNLALNTLPPKLQSLRLENLHGINDKGLQRFAVSHLATSIETIMFIDLEISSLVTISNIFSAHLANLKSFSLAQQRAPCIPSRSSVPDFFAPRLQQIHWEIRSEAGPLPILSCLSSSDVSNEQSFPFANQEPISCLATSFLAESIRDGAFPLLRRIRIPHDPQGLIQALCKPLATALLPCDIDILNSSTLISDSNDFPIYSDNLEPAPRTATDSVIGQLLKPRADSAIESLISSNDFSRAVLTPARSRLAAQSRILAARKAAFMTVRVYDPDGDLKINKVISNFIGQIGSQITYDLSPDRGRLLGGTIDDIGERNEWITNIQDLLSGPVHKDMQVWRRSWGNCGHRAGGTFGTKAIMVDELFRNSSSVAALVR